MQGKRTNIVKVTLLKMLKHGLSPFIFAITLFLVLIMVNYIVSIKTSGFDLTKGKINTFTEETSNLLKEINYPVSIKAFFSDAQQLTIKSLLDKYVKQNDRLSYQFIDPIKNPVAAEEYDVKLPRTLIFEASNKKSRINPPPRGQRHGERDITIALYRLMSETTNTAYFTTGHGEASVADIKSNGLSIVKDRLIEQNFLVETINLIETGNIPEDCTILIVAGPEVPFADEETAMVYDYAENMGSIFLMVKPGIQPNLDKVLRNHGIGFGDDYIYETSSKLTTEMLGPSAPLCAARDSSEITDNLPNQNFLLPFVRSAYPNAYRDDVTHIRLLASSENSWAESDLESASILHTNQKPTRNEDEEKGPITVASLTEREFELYDSQISGSDTRKVRSSFFGNASFITNRVVTPFPSNLNLFLNTVNWITRNEDIMDITPHLYTFTPIELTPSDRRLLTWLTLVIFPASILMTGIIVWYRRR